MLKPTLRSFDADENRRFLRLNTKENPTKVTKKRKGLDWFWRSKTDKNRQFLIFESDEIFNTESEKFINNCV